VQYKISTLKSLKGVFTKDYWFKKQPSSSQGSSDNDSVNSEKSEKPKSDLTESIYFDAKGDNGFAKEPLAIGYPDLADKLSETSSLKGPLAMPGTFSEPAAKLAPSSASTYSTESDSASINCPGAEEEIQPDNKSKIEQVTLGALLPDNKDEPQSQPQPQTPQSYQFIVNKDGHIVS
jgi:hypothetical protein